MQPGEVVTYQLPPEELKKYKEGDGKQMGAVVKIKGDQQKQKLTKADLTKAVYLKLVKEGMLDAQIRKQYNISSWTILKRLKDSWGITTDPQKKTKTNPVEPNVSNEQVLNQLNQLAEEQVETKKQLNEIRELLIQLSKEIKTPNCEYIQKEDEESNKDRTVELIRKLLKELL
ncbi:hypothetical protein [Brevibacillus borstelensis]|uniref:hypothetical protein n=1 Tax=Brevibacillus borstelensis TaxID=45462 RepID=UPI0030BF2375